MVAGTAAAAVTAGLVYASVKHGSKVPPPPEPAGKKNIEQYASEFTATNQRPPLQKTSIELEPPTVLSQEGMSNATVGLRELKQGDDRRRELEHKDFNKRFSNSFVNFTRGPWKAALGEGIHAYSDDWICTDPETCYPRNPNVRLPDLVQPRGIPVGCFNPDCHGGIA